MPFSFAFPVNLHTHTHTHTWDWDGCRWRSRAWKELGVSMVCWRVSCWCGGVKEPWRNHGSDILRRDFCGLPLAISCTGLHTNHFTSHTTGHLHYKPARTSRWLSLNGTYSILWSHKYGYIWIWIIYHFYRRLAAGATYLYRICHINYNSDKKTILYTGKSYALEMCQDDISDHHNGISVVMYC